jgi:ribosomal subunit interface protein
MTFRVSGKNIEVGEALRSRIGARIAEAMGKFFDGGYSGHATIGREGFGFRTECALHLDSGVTLHVDAQAPDPYDSADQAAQRIEKRLRRYKSRLKERRAVHKDANLAPQLSAPSYVISAPEHDSDEEVTAFDPVIVAEATTDLPRLSVSEAVMELDLTGAPVLVFRHAGHGRINIVYRRADGHFGWIDPPALSTGGH